MKKKSILFGSITAAVMAGALMVPAFAASQAPIILKDTNGNTVTPADLGGATEISLDALSKLGIKLVWDEQSGSFALVVGQKADTASTNSNGGTITTLATDSNTNSGSNSNTAGNTANGSYIGEAKAKEIALNHAGLTEADVNFYRTKLDYDNGRVEYDVEFWKDYTEYDYDIDATTGEILSFDYDIEGYAVNSTPQSNNDIGADKAKSVALSHAGVAESDTVFIYANLDYEHGRRVYDVEFFSGTKEYDYEIDAATGDILSYDFDVEWYTPRNVSAGNSGNYIGEAKVKEIVQQRAGVNGTFRELKMDYDDGWVVYEGEMRDGWTEYEFEIDAVTGNIIEWDVDWD